MMTKSINSHYHKLINVVKKKIIIQFKNDLDTYVKEDKLWLGPGRELQGK